MDRHQGHVVVLVGSGLVVLERLQEPIAGDLRRKADAALTRVRLMRDRPNCTPLGSRQSVMPSVKRSSVLPGGRCTTCRSMVICSQRPSDMPGPWGTRSTLPSGLSRSGGSWPARANANSRVCGIQGAVESGHELRRFLQPRDVPIGELQDIAWRTCLRPPPP